MIIKKIVLSLLVVFAISFVGTATNAQITGKLVNPNVLLVIDTGAGMDWLENGYWDEAQSVCEDANELVPAEERNRTSWQQLMDVFLGTIPQAPTDNYHCFVETDMMRPAVQFDTIHSDVVANTSEYWDSNERPHFRSVNCYDPREPGDRGDWDTYYNQCIGNSDYLSTHAGKEMESGAWCQYYVDYDYDNVDDADEKNYFNAGEAGGKEMCYNYHPKAQARNTNGILERYSSLVRFGMMTFDNKPAPVINQIDAHEGLWDYGTSRAWNCKQWQYNKDGAACTWNAGARDDNPNAIGRMVKIGDDIDATNQAVKHVFETTEPLNCSFTGALMDDVGQYLYETTTLGPAYGDGSDLYFNCRPKVVIFITDGAPTKSVEFPQDYCDNIPPEAPYDPVVATEPYSCPWNSSKKEVFEISRVVSHLSGGVDNVDPVYFVVIGLNVEDKGVVDCDTAPTWDLVPGQTAMWECNPPDDRCVQVEKLNVQADCLAGADGFLTPRQFLNEMALEGWPSDGSYIGEYPKQPPWRDDDNDCDICEDEPDDNSCGGEANDGMEDGAIFVNTPEELSGILDLILSSIMETTSTRTEVVTTDMNKSGWESESSWYNFNGGDGDEATSQYEFNSGYSIVGGKPWRGYLYRQGYTCQGEDSSGKVDSDVSEFHTYLKNQASSGNRTLYSVKTDDTLNNGTYNNDQVKNGLSDPLKEITGTSDFDDCYAGGPTGLCSGRYDIMGLLKQHLYGEIGERAEHPLADIYNSSPAILPPPLERLPISSYQNFKMETYSAGGEDKKYMERPPYLYVGTSDGVLHAFNVWSDTDSAAPETWGYVPGPLMSSLRLQYPITWQTTIDATGSVIDYYVPPAGEQYGIHQHVFGVDGSPVASDVRLYRDPASTVDEKEWWKSIVLGGLGKGGVGYYCLDVTDGVENKPKFRWEISQSLKGNNTVDSGAREAFDAMGVAMSKPALAYSYINAVPPGGSNESDHEVAVAILPGGFVNDENGGISISTGVYIVRAADGKLIKFLNPTNEDHLCEGTKTQLTENQRVAQLVGEPAVANGLRSGTVTDEAFIGDDRGRLWRIDMSSKYPDGSGTAKAWCLDMFFDTLITSHYPYKDCLPGSNPCCDDKDDDVTKECPDKSQFEDDFGINECTGESCLEPDFPYPRYPILSAPTIVQDENRNNIIIFGTGQIDGPEVLDHNRIFSLTETISYSVGDAINASSSTRSTPSINWWIGEENSPTTNILSLETWQTEIRTLMATTRVIGEDGANFDFFTMGEKLLGRLSVFEETAFFTTFVPMNIEETLDACNSGGSKLWAVDYTDPSDFKKMTVADDDLTAVSFREFPGEFLSGAKIIRRPSCNGAQSFALVVQRATPEDSGGGSGGSQPAVESVNIKLQSNRANFVTMGIDSWSLVFQ